MLRLSFFYIDFDALDIRQLTPVHRRTHRSGNRLPHKQETDILAIIQYWRCRMNFGTFGNQWLRIVSVLAFLAVPIAAQDDHDHGADGRRDRVNHPSNSARSTSPLPARAAVA